MNTKQLNTWKEIVQQHKNRRNDAILAVNALVELATPELASLLERLAEWADEAVLDGGFCLGEDMGTSSYEADDPDHKDDAVMARAFAARIREACLPVCRSTGRPACKSVGRPACAGRRRQALALETE